MDRKSPWRKYNFSYKAELDARSEYIGVTALNDDDADKRAKKKLQEMGIQYVCLLRLAGYK